MGEVTRVRKVMRKDGREESRGRRRDESDKGRYAHEIKRTSHV